MAATEVLVVGVLSWLVLAVLRVVVARVGRVGHVVDVLGSRSSGQRLCACEDAREVQAGRPASATAGRGEGSHEVVMSAGLAAVLVLLMLLIVCGNSGAPSPKFLAQCRATVLPVHLVSMTLQDLQARRQPPSRSAAELRSEQSALNTAVSGLRAPDAAARGHALVTAVERVRAWVTSGRRVPARVSSEFAADGQDLVAGCQQQGTD